MPSCQSATAEVTSVDAGDNLNPNPPHLLVGFQAVQVFDPATRQLETVAWLQRARWYASVATLADGNLLVVGGMQQVGGYKFVLLTDVMSQLPPTQSPCRHCHLA